jgi:hypothetical protein
MRTVLRSIARRAFGVLCAFGIALPAGCAGRTKTFVTRLMTATVEDGTITRIYNRLTGSEYIRPVEKAPDQDLVTGLIFATPGASRGEEATVLGPTSTQKGAKVLVESLERLPEMGSPRWVEKTDGSVEYQFERDGFTLSIAYTVDRESGDLLVNLKDGGSRSGLMGVRLGLGPVHCNGSLLVPAMGGIRAAAQDARYQF